MTATKQPVPRRRRRVVVVLLIVLLGVVAVCGGAWWEMIRMPGETFEGKPPPLDDPQQALRDELRATVEHLAGTIGERNLAHYPALVSAADYLEAELTKAGYSVERQEFEVRGLTCSNLIAEHGGGSLVEEIIVVGAHYDSAPGTPGANDNASGVAALVALAQRFADRPTSRTLRFVAFTNEEPPYFQTQMMGSRQYAARCRRQGENIVAAMSLETIGYYSDEPNSQQYPPPLDALYPSEGNFIGFVGNVASRDLVRQAVAIFRQHATMPSQGGAVPGDITGVGWSDHWSFWQEGYPALMVTDTAVFRYPWYHHPQDTPDKVNFDSMAHVVVGLEAVIADLAGAEER